MVMLTEDIRPPTKLAVGKFVIPMVTHTDPEGQLGGGGIGP